MKVVQNERILLTRLFVDLENPKCPFCDSDIMLNERSKTFCENCGNFFKLGCVIQEPRYIIQVIVDFTDENGQFIKAKPTFENALELDKLVDLDFKFTFRCLCSSCVSKFMNQT